MNQNLTNQFKKLHTNQGSFQTKKTYREAFVRFLNFVSEQYKAQNIKNLGDKHLKAYISAQLDDEKSDNYVRKEASAIRFFLNLAGSTTTLTNRELKISAREYYCLDGISELEYKKARALAAAQDKDYELEALAVLYHFGVRINELVNLRFREVRNALETGELELSHGTKGGRHRTIPANSDVQKKILQDLFDSRGRYNCGCTGIDDKVFASSREKGAVASQKSRLQNWMSRNSPTFADHNRIGNCTCHSFRRSYAQLNYDKFRQKGLSKEAALGQVKKLLGHSVSRGLDITAVYVKNKW